MLPHHAGSKKALEEITAQVNQDAVAAGLPEKTVEEVALGFVSVANEAMCRPIRALTEARGFDVSKHVLASFGGAGGQHACAIAKQLGMKTVFVHRYASVLSAVGMGLASVVQEAQVRPFSTFKVQVGLVLMNLKLSMEGPGSLVHLNLTVCDATTLALLGS